MKQTTITIYYGQKLSCRYRGEVEVVHRPPTGFETVDKGAVFLRYFDKGSEGTVESRAPFALLAGHQIRNGSGKVVWDPDSLRCCLVCGGRGVLSDHLVFCHNCVHGVPRVLLDEVRLIVKARRKRAG